VLQGKHGKDDRSGLGIYGTTKLFNIMLAKEYSRRLQVTQLCFVVPQLAKPCCTMLFSSVQRFYVTLLCKQQFPSCGPSQEAPVMIAEKREVLFSCPAVPIFVRLSAACGLHADGML